MANITAASQAPPKYHNKYNVNVLAYDTHSWKNILNTSFYRIFPKVSNQGKNMVIIISKTRIFFGKVSKYEKMEKIMPKDYLVFSRQPRYARSLSIKCWLTPTAQHFLVQTEARWITVFWSDFFYVLKESVSVGSWWMPISRTSSIMKGRMDSK